MLYALFMILILTALGAMWRNSSMALPLLLFTIVAACVFTAMDMTSPLTLSF